MNATEVIAKTLELNDGLVRMALEGLSDEDLTKRPSANDNPAGWLLWHQTRVEDAIIAHASGVPQVWVAGRWHERFGMDPDPSNIGVKHTLEQVMALKATKEDLLGYARAVRERTTAYLQGLDPAELDKEIPDVIGGTIRLGVFLGRFTVDHFHHSGQICYLRGHLTGWGWFPM